MPRAKSYITTSNCIYRRLTSSLLIFCVNVVPSNTTPAEGTCKHDVSSAMKSILSANQTRRSCQLAEQLGRTFRPTARCPHLSIHVVDGNVEVAHGLAGMQIARQDTVRPGLGDEIRHQFGCDGFPSLCLQKPHIAFRTRASKGVTRGKAPPPH